MKRRAVPVALVVAAVLAMTLGVAQADLKFTAVLHAWDDGKARFESGNATIVLDGTREPFYQVIDFDNDPHANACEAGTSSAWAGDAEIGLYHVDNNPAGGKGWQSTQGWSLVKCSIFDDPKKKYALPADILYSCDPDSPACQLIPKNGIRFDREVACTSGNCSTEIVTDFNLNFDLNCDGKLDAEFSDKGGICLYWEAVKPPKEPTYWSGNFQARAGILGQGFTGDKTINFDIQAPTAVRIGNFVATANVGLASVLAWIAAALLGGAALFLTLRKRA